MSSIMRWRSGLIGSARLLVEMVLGSPAMGSLLQRRGQSTR
jgi:hypothetical protein